MSNQRPVYFVARISGRGYRPWPDAEFVIQHLDHDLLAVFLTFLNAKGHLVGVGHVEETPVRAPEGTRADFPEAVLAVVLQQERGGQFVCEDGTVVDHVGHR